MQDDVPDDSKLTRTKRQWAEAGKFLTGRDRRQRSERLPPGQHLVTRLADPRSRDRARRWRLDAWRLDVTGLVETRLSLDWAAFAALPQTRADHRHPLRHHLVALRQRVAGRAGPRPSRPRDAAARGQPRHAARHDGYTTNLPLMDFAGRGRDPGDALEGRAADPRARRPAARRGAASLLLEKRQMAEGDRADRRRPGRVLGAATATTCTAIPGASSAIRTTSPPATGLPEQARRLRRVEPAPRGCPGRRSRWPGSRSAPAAVR